jgi:predicted nicotinamide N-methyase
VDPPFWVCSWPGGQAIARYVLDHPEEVRGRVVLDLGCGNGLGAVAAAMVGAARAIAADIDPLAVGAAAVTAGLNAVTVEGVDSDLLVAPPRVPPISCILVGDMFYERRLAEAVDPWLRSARAAGASVWIADPGRAYLPDRGLLPVASYDVPVSPEIESVRQRTTRVYRLEQADAPHRRPEGRSLP